MPLDIAIKTTVYFQNAPNISPHVKEVSSWMEQSSAMTESHGDSGYHSNNSSASRTPKSAYSSQKNTGSSLSYSAVKVSSDLNRRSYKLNMISKRNPFSIYLY